MKEIFDYINSNSFLSTIIGVIVGGLLQFVGMWLINNKERKEKIRHEKILEWKNHKKNKPELRIIKKEEFCNAVPDISTFLTHFDSNYENEIYKVIYSKDILKKQNHEYKDFYIKNIGNTSINELYLCATFKENNSLLDYEELNYYVKNKFVNYSYCYDKKIMPGETILIRIYYQRNYQICHPFSCTLAIVFRDDLNYLWEQPFWYEKDNLYEPMNIDYKTFRRYINDGIED